MPHNPLLLDLGERSYAIHIGSNLLDQVGEMALSVMSGKRAFIITDDNVAPLYLDRVVHSFLKAGIKTDSFVAPHGEGSKSFATLEAVQDALLSAKAERSTLVVALGGGVIGDLAGFAASICLRGLDFIQIPTTLLSQVDSSVGGKTGINTRQGKNLVGTFYQPRLVLADLSTLDTLPRRQVVAGYAEVVKYGCIDDEPFFTWLEKNGPALLDGDIELRTQAVRHSCEAKARTVAADEREGGIRALLNLGHTFGHAFEAEVGFTDEILHGEAVALGMVMAFTLSVDMGLAPKADLDRLIAHFTQVGLPTKLPANRPWDAARLQDHMAGDKKIKDGRITFVLAKGIGKSFLTRDVPIERLTAMLTGFINAS
jgi:3-dehydroquinate synthase